jgi:hypothetical protein
MTDPIRFRVEKIDNGFLVSEVNGQGKALHRSAAAKAEEVGKIIEDKVADWAKPPTTAKKGTT